MSNTNVKDNQSQLNHNLLLLRRKAYDVKFDLDDTQYQTIENIGSGAYGVVCSAKIKDSPNEHVAIKKIPHVFDVPTSAKRTYRELKILKHFKHRNIISIRDILLPKNINDFTDVYVVFDLMESDLHKIISSKQPLSDDHVRYFLYQILCGLAYIHSAGVVHRDLKPSNLLVNANCELRIGDFGMARGVAPNASSDDASRYNLTQYVATRWYRAPELIMGHCTYTGAVDLWSTGCILAEMLTRKPLFPGKDLMQQLRLIVERLGNPPRSFMDNTLSDVIRSMVRGMAPRPDPLPLPMQFPHITRKARELLAKLLVYPPENRHTARQLLGDLFLNKYRDPSNEPLCEEPFDFTFESKLDSRSSLRSAILGEILSFHPEVSVPESSALSVTQVDHSYSALHVKEDSDATSVPEEIASNVVIKSTVAPVAGTVVFKKPVAPAVATVHAPGGLLPLPAGSDVDMLSAASSRSVEMMSASSSTSTAASETASKSSVNRTPMAAATGAKSKRTHAPKEKKKTISEDTKLVLKAAILSHKDKGDTRRPTAAQRQKEREAKRQQRLQRAKERRAKEKEKSRQLNQRSDHTDDEKGEFLPGSTTMMLSTEDQQLLTRWQNLQHVQSGSAAVVPAPSNLNNAVDVLDLETGISKTEDESKHPTAAADPAPEPVFTPPSFLDDLLAGSESFEEKLSADLRQHLAITDSDLQLPSLSLAHTPRGSGIGYGLNFDLDDLQLIGETVAAAGPDSAEAMAAWLDVCQGAEVRQDDLAALEAELCLGSSSGAATGAGDGGTNVTTSKNLASTTTGSGSTGDRVSPRVSPPALVQD